MHYPWITYEFKNKWLFGGLKNENAHFTGVSRVLQLFEFFADTYILWSACSKQHNILWCFSFYSTDSLTLQVKKGAFWWLICHLIYIMPHGISLSKAILTELHNKVRHQPPHLSLKQHPRLTLLIGLPSFE